MFPDTLTENISGPKMFELTDKIFVKNNNQEIKRKNDLEAELEILKKENEKFNNNVKHK